MGSKILVVDDDPVQRRLLEGMLTRHGHDALCVDSGEAALRELESNGASRFAAIILDLMMPGIDGIGVMETMRSSAISIPVIVQTAQGGIETVVRAMRAGAFDFVVKPVSPDRLKIAVANAQKIGSLRSVTGEPDKARSSVIDFSDIITTSPSMQRIMDVARRAASSHIPVLIEGESGVGKELFAHAIQSGSSRRKKPFVVVNCGALPENLAESILFGHEKGSFTGASEKHVGKFEEANGGTLFLDEIGELPLDIQVKLLRAIQEGEIDPVGSRKPVKVDIRLISATNRNLLEEVSAGRFREDLYYRISVLPMMVPPLRHRREDIPLLVRHFMQRFASAEKRTDLQGVDAHAEELLSGFDWPGNIRQLENAVFRAVVLAAGPDLGAVDFPQIASLHQVDLQEAQSLPPSIAGKAIPLQPISEPPPMVTPLQASEPSLAGAGLEGNASFLKMTNATRDVRPLEELEAEIIRYAIVHYDGRMAKVARKLGIGRSTLYRKLKELGLDAGAEPSAQD
ncbi:MAG: sigma-54 dependent transcriptional regulator [Rhizobiaceae bacterium]